jgi:hypothetical protein
VRACACMCCACELYVRSSVRIQVNEKFASIFGYTAEKMLEQQIGQFCTGNLTEVLRVYTLVRMHYIRAVDASCWILRIFPPIGKYFARSPGLGARKVYKASERVSGMDRFKPQTCLCVWK